MVCGVVDMKLIDSVMSIFYGVGKSLGTVLWISVAWVILVNQGFPISGLSFNIAFIMAGVGSAFYGLRSYEAKL